METFRILETANHNNYFELGLQNIEIPLDHEDPLEDKLKYFNDALERFNAKLVSNDFLSKISENDVIEVYMPDMNQVYRSMNFFKTCSYDPYYLFQRPWFELFHRADNMNNKILSLVGKVMDAKAGTTQYDIPTHYLQETGGDRNITQVDCLYACTLVDKDTGELFGFASTARAKNVEGVIPLFSRA